MNGGPFEPKVDSFSAGFWTGLDGVDGPLANCFINIAVEIGERLAPWGFLLFLWYLAA